MAVAHHHKAKRKQKNYHHIKIGTINVRTSKCEMKLAEHVLQIKKLQQDICCMQETRMAGQGEVEFKDEVLMGWRVLYYGLRRKSNAGVAIVLSPRVKLVDVEYLMEGRIILARVSLHGVKLNIVSCYSPNETYSIPSKEIFYNTLSKAITTTKKSHPSFKLVVCGDFNATIGKDCSQNNSLACVGRFNDDEPTSFNGTKLIEVAENNSLYILNSLFATKTPQHRWSFKSNLGYFRRLDYIMGEWFVKRASQNCRVYPNASVPFDSDHRIVVLDAMFPTKSKRKAIFSKNSCVNAHVKPNMQVLRDSEDVRIEYSRRLDDILGQPSSTKSVDELTEDIVSAIHKAAEEKIPSVQRNSDNKPWVDNDFLTLLEKRRKTTNAMERKTLSKEIRKLRIELKSAYYKAKANRINQASEQRNTEEEFRLAKDYSALSKSSRQVIQPEKLEEHFAQHFGERLFSMQPEMVAPDRFPHIIPPRNEERVDESAPMASELEECMSKFKNGKCQGTDKIFSEQLKYCYSKQLLLYLVFLLGMIWQCVTIPSTWLQSSITCLYKKGLRTLPENYRGLSIIATLSKLISMVFIQRIRPIYETIIMPNQYGFRKNRSTNDAIYILRHILEKEKRPLYLCFIDLKAAYDWIPREALFRVLEISCSRDSSSVSQTDFHHESPIHWHYGLYKGYWSLLQYLCRLSSRCT